MQKKEEQLKYNSIIEWINHTFHTAHHGTLRQHRTSSDSSILNVIFSTESPILLSSRLTPAPLSADVLVALGSSPSRSRKSRKSGSMRRCGWEAVRFRYLQEAQNMRELLGWWLSVTRYGVAIIHTGTHSTVIRCQTGANKSFCIQW